MRYALVIIIAIIFNAGALCAQDNNDEGGPVQLGSGLTKKQIGNFAVVAAEDANVSTDGKKAYVEDIYQYVSRKFKAVEARLKKLEEGQEDIKNRLKRIEYDLSRIKKAVPLPQ